MTSMPNGATCASGSQTTARKRVVPPATKAKPPLLGRAKRKSPDGVATSDLVVSANVGKNEDLFPTILQLHVPDGATVADVTYGGGIFWKNVQPGKYDLKATDIATGVDCRDLPYGDGSIGCVVLDPPYM